MVKEIERSNPNEAKKVMCSQCDKIKEHHAKGMCYSCYKKLWKPKKIICKSCGRKRFHKAFGLCPGCHTRLHHYHKTLAYNAKKYHGIEFAFYREVTKECDNCGFNKIVQIHHLNGNTRDNSKNNVVGLCPNCHKMIHMYQFYEEIKEKLSKKGFDVSIVHPTNYVNRREKD